MSEVSKTSTGRWLRYNTELLILVCARHGYAVVNLDGHLRSHHKETDARSRAALVAKFSGLELRRPANEEFRHGPSNPRGPIAGLPVRDGWACKECDMLTPSRKWLRVHYNEGHVVRGNVPKEPDVKIQTLFTVPSNAVHYFCVSGHGPDTDREEGGEGGNGHSSGAPAAGGQDVTTTTTMPLIDAVLARWVQDQGEQESLLKVLADGAAKHEITNWLRRAGWSTHFAQRDLGDIYGTSRMPGPADTELRRLVKVVDGMFFDRCIGGLKTIPLMARQLLASPHPTEADSRPFGPLQERTSMDRYLVYWKRFLCYCMNVLWLDEEQLLQCHGFKFTTTQRASLEQLWAHLQDEERAEKDLQSEVLQVSARFWTQRLTGDPFDSPLWHFIAVLGIDGESGQLRPAHLFTYVLAGMVYVGRALLAEYAIPAKERLGMIDLEQRFAKVRSQWLCKATYSPMGYTLSLLLYGKKIARETGSRLMVSWSKRGDLMYFMGKPVLMQSIRDMINEMVKDAEDLLWDKLMFKEGDDVRFHVPLGAIDDDLSHTQRGRSFVHANGLAGKEVEMLQDIVGGTRRADLLRSDGEWEWRAIQAYLKVVRQFEELLVVLTQTTWGGPARGDEIGGLRLINGINRDRNVFIVDGEVVLVTQYHKSLAHFDSPKVIPRFLPYRVGQLLVMYITYIRPLTDRWEAERWSGYGEMKAPSDFIWHDENGPWEGTRISKAMARWTYHYMGRRLTLQDWRHVAIAISKKHARERGAARADFADDIGEDEEGEQYESPDDLAAAHTTETSANYGVTIDILKRLTAESLEVFGKVSRRWHKFLGLDQDASSAAENEASKVERCDDDDGCQVRPRKRAKIMKLENTPAAEKTPSRDAILKALRVALRDDHAQFRSPQQEEAVRLAASKETPIVAVLPTGGGKSLVFMIPAMLPGAGVTVVVAPYAELKRQLVSRCVDVGLDCKQWPQARDSWPRVVIISAEAASSDDFLQWAADLRVSGRLDRVVIDECHLTFTAAHDYRKKLHGLVRLRSLGCPFVFLTGTLPPLSQRDFEEAMHLQEVRYIRASSHKTNTKYSVARVGNGRGLLEVSKLVREGVSSAKADEKGVIYCGSRAKCKAMARLLGCHYYHGEPEDFDAHFHAQREAGFHSWLRGETSYIVATAALGTGIDVPGITHIIHLDVPHSLIDYAQETGRAGRAGEGVEAVIVVEDKDWPSSDPKAAGQLEPKQREVASLVQTSRCRRRVLGQCLDSDVRQCRDIEGAISCDNCHREGLAWKSEMTAQGLIMAEEYGKRAARGLAKIEAALEEVRELDKQGCRACWLFEGSDAARHSWYTCGQLEASLTFGESMKFQRMVDYKKDRQAGFLSCWYCHVSQELCRDGFKSGGGSCRWKHTVIPVALAACSEESLLTVLEGLAGREFKGQADYAGWLGRKHGKLVYGHEMTNAMAAFCAVVTWRGAQGVK
jgi:superfamily II DNA helicase RecQ